MRTASAEASKEDQSSQSHIAYRDCGLFPSSKSKRTSKDGEIKPGRRATVLAVGVR